MDDNLFLRLHTWASGQDENFVTESFAYLLRHLLKKEAEVGVELLRWLTGGKLGIPAEEAERVSITTQAVVEGKRPDIEITAPGWLVYVEVKVEAALATEQLANYRYRLDRSGVKHTALVLLTRYAPWIPGVVKPDVSLRWYQVANWLDDRLRTDSIQDAGSKFIVEQFYGFLGGRRMTMGHVDRELQRGVPSLVSLLTMLRHVLVEHGLTVRDNMRGYEWFGFEVGPAGAVEFYIGVYAHEPTMLKCRTWQVRIDQTKIDALDNGRVWRQGGQLRWEYTRDLGNEETQFYDLPTPKQVERLSDYVKTYIELLRRVTADSLDLEETPLEGGSGDVSL